MSSPKKETYLTFTLFWSARTDKIFPLDPEGDFTLNFQNKHYKMRKQNLEYAKLLYSLINQNQGLCSYQLNFAYKTDPNAFELVMKLLFGFKSVEIPQSLLIQVCLIILALDIDNIDGFQSSVKKETISRINEDNILEAFQMANDLNDKKIENTCFDCIKNIGFLKVFSENRISKLTEKAFCGLLAFHGNEKKQFTNAEDIDSNKYLSSKALAEVITQYCDENFKDPILWKEKTIDYTKDYVVMHQSESIQNAERLFTHDCFNDTKLYKSKFQISYIQLKNLERKGKRLNEETSANKKSLQTLEGKLTSTNDALVQKIDGVKKLCLEENRSAIDKVDETIRTRGREVDEKIAKHDIELDKLQLGIDEQQVKLRTNENKQVESRRYLENRLSKKIKEKMDRQQSRFEAQILTLKEEMKSQKSSYEEEISRIKEEQKEEIKKLGNRLENKMDIIVKDLTAHHSDVDELRAARCSIF